MAALLNKVAYEERNCASMIVYQVFSQQKVQLIQDTRSLVQPGCFVCINP